MNETRSIIEWLRKWDEEDVTAARQFATERRRNGCLSPVRLHLGVLRQDWTPAERDHLSACARCAALREQGETEQWHPTPAALAAQWAGSLPANEDAAILQHIMKHGCAQCARIHALYRPQPQHGPARLNVFCRVLARLETLPFLQLVPVPTAASQAAAGERPSFRVRTTDPATGLTATLRESGRKQLVVDVEAADVSLAGRSVAVGVVGDLGPEHTLTAVVTLEADQNGCWGQGDFGEFRTAVPVLGVVCGVVPVLLNPEDIVV